MINIRKISGATLVELIIAMVIISTTVIAFLNTYRIITLNSTDPMITKQSVMIAESLMDEIMGKSIEKPIDGFTGPFNESNRKNFDSLMDYNGFTMVGIKNLNGVAIPALSSYSVIVNINNVAIGTIPVSDSYQINIQVTNSLGIIKFKGYRFNYES